MQRLSPSVNVRASMSGGIHFNQDDQPYAELSTYLTTKLEIPARSRILSSFAFHLYEMTFLKVLRASNMSEAAWLLFCFDALCIR